MEGIARSIVLSLVDAALGGPAEAMKPRNTLHQNNLAASKCEEILDYNETVEQELAHFRTPAQRDGFRLLRGLCRLAMRKLPTLTRKTHLCFTWKHATNA